MSIKHLVLSGSGPNGLLQLGAIEEYIRSGVFKVEDLESACGCSAGSIIAIFLALRFPLDEVIAYLVERPWHKFAQVNWLEVNSSGGLLPLSKWRDAVVPLFRAYGVPIEITFEEVFQRTGVDLHIFCTCLNTFEPVGFHRGTHADMAVLTASSFSSALPPLFPPGLHEGKLYIDGGFSNNFPLKARVEALGHEQANSILAINAVGKSPDVASDCTTMPLLELANVIVCKTIMSLSKLHDNHAVGLGQCEHYIVLECQSLFDPVLWDAFLFSEKGKRELVERGAQIARDKLSTR